MLEYKVIEIFTGEEARWRGNLLEEAVVEYVRSLKIAARCIVIKGTDGCYENGERATKKMEILSYNMPVKIEILLPASELNLVLPGIEERVTDGIVAVRPLDAVCHKVRQSLFPRRIRVKDIMTPSPRSVRVTTPVRDVVRLLLSSHFGGVPVVDRHGRPSGIITPGDLISRGGMPLKPGLLQQLDRGQLDSFLDSAARKTAFEIMTHPVMVIEESRQVVEAVNTMLAHGFKRLPVVDEKGVLVGMLSRADVFHMISKESPDWEAMRGKKITVDHVRYVRDVMLRDTHAVLPNTPIRKVIRLMGGSAVQRVAVVDASGRFLGLISDDDVLNAFSAHRAGVLDYLVSKLPFMQFGRRHREVLQHSRKTTAAEVMKADVITVREETSIDEAIRLMATKELKRLPVLDSQGRFRGMVSRDSVLRAGTLS